MIVDHLIILLSNNWDFHQNNFFWNSRKSSEIKWSEIISEINLLLSLIRSGGGGQGSGILVQGEHASNFL